MINETGTMTGGGGKPRGGKMCLGSAAPKTGDTKQAAAELAQSEEEFTVSKQVRHAWGPLVGGVPSLGRLKCLGEEGGHDGSLHLGAPPSLSQAHFIQA